MANNGTSSERQTLRSKLLRQWVVVHRPDVIKAIEAEVDAQVPKKMVRRGAKVPMPKSLAALK